MDMGFLPCWSSVETAAFVVDANEGTFGTVAVGVKSELGFIGTLENILLIPVNGREENFISSKNNLIVILSSLFFGITIS